MAAGKHDTSVAHFEWLVDGRSENQKSTLKLYSIIDQNEHKLNSNVEFQNAAQELAAIAFSLWRAVFLSDTTGEYEDQLADVKTFLISLISDNTVLYVTDKNAKNWSFRYYLDNAKYRLRGLGDGNLGLISEADLKKVASSEKDEWLNAHNALVAAMTKFAEIVAR